MIKILITILPKILPIFGNRILFLLFVIYNESQSNIDIDSVQSFNFLLQICYSSIFCKSLLYLTVLMHIFNGKLPPQHDLCLYIKKRWRSFDFLRIFQQKITTMKKSGQIQPHLKRLITPTSELKDWIERNSQTPEE